VDKCLRREGSLFRASEAVWTKAVIDEAAAPLLIDDTRELDYVTKLRDQLEGLSDEAVTFTAELLYVHVLPIDNMGPAAKRRLIEDVLSWRREPIQVPDGFWEPFTGGVANYGAGLAQRDRYVKYLVRFAQAWVNLERPERERLLGEPWEFRAFVHGLGGPALMQREAILHLVFPDVFDNALAPSDKTSIRKAFTGIPVVGQAENDDRALTVVREKVEAALSGR
jgi:5-methylcytosine-specific restriction protein B